PAASKNFASGATFAVRSIPIAKKTIVACSTSTRLIVALTSKAGTPVVRARIREVANAEERIMVNSHGEDVVQYIHCGAGRGAEPRHSASERPTATRCRRSPG